MRVPLPADAADRAVTMIADLAEALGTAHTEATIGPRTQEALAKHLPVLGVSVTLAGEPATGASFASAARTLRLPLRDREGSLGVALVALGAGGGDEPALTPTLLDALARQIAGAARTARLLGRVAGLSRRALDEKKTLSAELARVALPPDVVAAGPEMRAVFLETLPLVARHDTTVLLLGETGTGKEVAARRLHALSPRAGRPFLQINCGALPEGLVESALFGHERGAFTGALARHKGLFERAHGGTLLLDEVGELSRPAQVKLLRVLEGKTFERLGGEATLRADVRVVSATHRPLAEMVAEGSFREDLYYRLAVFPIVLPPLRARPFDLAPLVHALAAKLAQRLGRPAPRITEETLGRLREHPFPGNVRELENVLERALITSPEGALELPRDFGAPLAASPLAASAGASGQAPSYEEATRSVLKAALASSGGRIYGPGGAAERLGLPPSTLQSKLKRLGLRTR